MATVSAPLNAAPALPEDREKQQLPPKSYANAVEEDAPAESANVVNGTNGTNGANGTSKHISDDANGGHQASVLRIVDTVVPPTEDTKEEKQEKSEERPQYERQESKHEYSATVCCYLSMFAGSIAYSVSTGP